MTEEVDRWLADCGHPLADAMQRVREIILSHSSMTECIKWRAPTFVFRGNMASFHHAAKKSVSLVFHTGADIPGGHALLQGESKKARTIRFNSVQEVEDSKESLMRIVQSWCEMNSD